MPWDEEDDTTIYKVVINHEEQYSIWPADRENALGWSDVGKTGTKQEVLDYIEEVWTDMRPLGLRRKMFADELESKFGKLSDRARGRINKANGRELQAWSNGLATAKSADELLGL